MTESACSHIEFGTCSWNYDSWMGLVYSSKASHSAAYLCEYAQLYSTVEVDSWFYRLPSAADVREYRACTPENFSFACKLTESLSLTHRRSRNKAAPLVVNPDFLSPEIYADYLEATEALQDRIFLLELEFEYLNKQKMAGLEAFMHALEGFINALEKAGTRNKLPLGVECRNGNYLTRDYFRFLKEYGIAHVFSEKQYLPHVYELYAKHADLIGDRVAVRLLGGDRKAIEEKTKNRWDNIVDPKEDLTEIANMLRSLGQSRTAVKVYVNNHYEGSAPKSIERLQALL